VAEKSMTLFAVFLQGNEVAIEKQNIERRRIRIHFILAQSQKPHVSAALFQQCTTIVLIHFIDSRG
jgi:hypothetical protein